jgi:glucose-6-phosphate isomerase
MEVDPGVTSGDYLSGFLQGTRLALSENGRESITITVHDVSPGTIGKLIALCERAVGFYASLVNINAYHQPGVEAGKKAAAAVLEVQRKVVGYLKASPGTAKTAEGIASATGEEANVETIFKVLEHLAANPESGIDRLPSDSPFSVTYCAAKG